MFTSVLLLVVIFLAGLMTTNLPTKKLLAWLISLSVKNSSPTHVVTTSTMSPAGGKTDEKKSVSCSNKEELKRVFATFDKNSDGHITRQELRDSLKNIGIIMEEKDIKELITSVDTNQDGLIDLDEFCESFASLLGRGGEDKMREGEKKEANDLGSYAREDDEDRDLKEAFDVFDEDRDGVITVEELGIVLSSMGFKQGNRLEECSKMIKKVDMDGDGMVNFDEFKKMMKHGHGFVPID